MAQYINKSALTAEIERRIKSLHQVNSPREQAVLYECKDILSFIDTLEVKEVDLDVMQRMEECPYRQVGCTMYEGHILECNGACSWVVDYLNLKQLKAQKGE